MQTHQQALRLYPRDVVGDPTLIHLDHAAGIGAGGDAPAAAQMISATLAALPNEHRAGIFIDTAIDVLNGLPLTAQHLPAVRQGRLVLADLARQTHAALPADSRSNG